MRVSSIVSIETCCLWTARVVSISTRKSTGCDSSICNSGAGHERGGAGPQDKGADQPRDANPEWQARDYRRHRSAIGAFFWHQRAVLAQSPEPLRTASRTTKSRQIHRKAATPKTPPGSIKAFEALPALLCTLCGSSDDLCGELSPISLDPYDYRVVN